MTKEWAQLDRLREGNVVLIWWTSSTVKSNAIGGHFPWLKSLFYPLKNSYDVWKMLSHEGVLIKDAHD